MDTPKEEKNWVVGKNGVSLKELAIAADVAQRFADEDDEKTNPALELIEKYFGYTLKDREVFLRPGGYFNNARQPLPLDNWMLLEEYSTSLYKACYFELCAHDPDWVNENTETLLRSLPA